DAGQVVVVGSPRGRAKEVNFYDDLHRRYIEVTGAHGNMLFEPAHTRLAGAWDINKAQHWLLGALASGQLNLNGLITQRIKPTELGSAYEGLLKKKEEYLGVVVRWKGVCDLSFRGTINSRSRACVYFHLSYRATDPSPLHVCDCRLGRLRQR